MTISTTCETASAAMTINAREGYTLLKGLLYGIGSIQSLPEARQERSDMVEMCAIARRVPLASIDQALDLLWSVERHLGHKIDLWPEGGGGEPDGSFSEEEYDLRDDVRYWINMRDARFAASQALKDAPPSNVVTFIGGPDEQEGEAA